MTDNLAEALKVTIPIQEMGIDRIQLNLRNMKQFPLFRILGTDKCNFNLDLLFEGYGFKFDIGADNLSAYINKLSMPKFHALILPRGVADAQHQVNGNVIGRYLTHYHIASDTIIERWDLLIECKVWPDARI